MTPIHAPTRRRVLTLVLAGGLTVTAAACSGGGEAASPDTTDRPPRTTVAPTTTKATTTTSSTTSTTAAPTTTEAPTTTTEPVIPRMPLTGQPLAEGEVPPDRPALVVKIDNNPRARPQHGLNSADIVFEEIVEVGTRFAAVFHSTDANPVGPIRSGRTQDIDLLSGLHQPLFAWSGGNAGVTRAIADSDFIDTYHSAPRGTYYRDGCCAPHNFFSTTDALWALTTPEAGRPTPLFSYLKPGEVPAGTDLSHAEIRMDTDNVAWDWDAPAQSWFRQINGRVHEDANTGEQVNAANVVVLLTPYRPSPVDARSPEAITIGGGDAVVFTGGKMIEARWLRGAPEEGIALFDANGAGISLNPGRTWVELADPETYTLTTS